MTKNITLKELKIQHALGVITEDILQRIAATSKTPGVLQFCAEIYCDTDTGHTRYMLFPIYIIVSNKHTPSKTLMYILCRAIPMRSVWLSIIAHPNCGISHLQFILSSTFDFTSVRNNAQKRLEKMKLVRKM
jgi:hypothetical protein